jgi:hypothetical protein
MLGNNMNKQMEDLMYHAGLTAQGCWDEMDNYDKQAIEKFAELIVRECAEMVRIQNEQFMENESHYGVVSADVLKHFGVEE